MEVIRIDGVLAVKIPADVAAMLGLREGDRVEVTRAEERRPELTEEERDAAIARIRASATPLPTDYKFDREEANAR